MTRISPHQSRRSPGLINYPVRLDPQSSWRPKVSSPLSSELKFTPSSSDQHHPISTFSSLSFTAPAGNQIFISLFLDGLVSIWLARTAILRLIERGHHLSFPYQSPSDCRSTWSSSSTTCTTTTSTQSVLIPQIFITTVQSDRLTPPTLVPILFSSFITLKALLGLLLLRTSRVLPINYLKLSLISHLALAYAAVAYVRLTGFGTLAGPSSFLDSSERLSQLSGHVIMFIAGVAACLGLLAATVLPLLWLSSAANPQDSEQQQRSITRRSFHHHHHHHYHPLSPLNRYHQHHPIRKHTRL